MEVPWCIASDIDKGTASARVSDDDRRPGRVFELDAGWCVEFVDLTSLRGPGTIDAVLDRKRQLARYPNRKGGRIQATGPSEVFAEWLMQGDADGAKME